MPFFRTLDETAPAHDLDLPWPLYGMAYVVMFMGPLPGSISVGLIVAGKVGFAIGFFIGMGITAANCLLFDCYVDSAMVRLQVVARRPIARVLINIAGFLWAVALCAFSMWVTLAVLNRLAYAGA
jgi:hypothetical protein